MSSTSIGLNQTQSAASSDLRAIVDIARGSIIPLPAGNGELTVQVVSPSVYKANYLVQTDDLLGGPANMIAPQIVQSPADRVLSVVLQGLWAHDELGSTPIFTYRWQRNGVDIPGATGTQYMPLAADAEQTLQVVEMVTDAGGVRSQTSNTIEIAALPDPFAVTLAPDGTLQITGNDGRSFTLDDPADVHDGTYSVAAGALAAGPVGLAAPALSALTMAEAGATLAITPGLFAYDPALGPVTLSYTTNGTNAVDVSDPAAPRLLIDTADAEASLTVTATATQAGASIGQTSNTIEIAALPDTFAVTLAPDGTLQITGNDGRSFTLDDALDRYDGSYSVLQGTLSNGPVALVDTVLNGTAEVGQRLTISPGLFGYNPEFGPMSVSYATNGTNAVDVTDPDNPTLLVAAADQGATLTVTATATQGANSTDSMSNGVEIPPPVSTSSPTLIQNATMSQLNTASLAAPVFTVDLSAAQAGDLLCVWYGVLGSASVARTMQVDGGATVTPIALADAQVDGVYFEFTMTAAGTASSTIQINLSGSRASHCMRAWVVRGGTRDDEAVSAVNNGTGTNPVSVTPAGAANLIVGAVLGRAPLFGGHTWSGATEFAYDNTGGGYDTSGASVTDVAVGSHNVGFTADAGATSNQTDFALVAVAYSGA